MGPSRPCVGPTECPLGPKPPRLGHARGATRPLFCPTRPLFCPTRPLFCHLSARLGHFSARLGHSFVRLGHLSGRLGRVLNVWLRKFPGFAVQTRCTTHAAALLAFVMREALGSRPAPGTPSAKRSVGTRRAASMQDTVPEETARAAQLAPSSAVTASAVGGSATRSVVADCLRRRAARRGARAIARRRGEPSTIEGRLARRSALITVHGRGKGSTVDGYDL